MATMREPKEVVQRFLDHGSTADGWNMEVISECFSEHGRVRTGGAITPGP
jgi:hypothetical protein